MNQITGQIQSVMPDRQVNGKQTYKIIINGMQFGAWDAAYLQKVGQDGTWDYTIKNQPRRDGKGTNTYYTLVDLTPRQPQAHQGAGSNPTTSPQNLDGIADGLKEINYTLQTIADAIKRQNVHTPFDEDDIPVIR